MPDRTPIFCVVLKDGEHWQVEAEWPDGTIEPVEKFKAGFEALHWVKTQSAAWLPNVWPTNSKRAAPPPDRAAYNRT